MKDIIAGMRYRMLKWLEETDDIVPFQRDERFTPRMMIAKGCAVAGMEHEAEIRAKVEQGASFIELMTFAHGLMEKGKRE